MKFAHTLGLMLIACTASSAIVSCNDGLKSEKQNSAKVENSQQSPEESQVTVPKQDVGAGKCGFVDTSGDNGTQSKETIPTANKFSNETFTVGNVSFNMIAVEGGTFQMGSNDGDNDEKPVHKVTIDNYYIGETEVTQELWEAVMNYNHSDFIRSPQHPVVSVTWDECQDFIKKLNEITGKNFRLPTEAEWEYAARGGNKSQGYKYSGSDNIDDVAWYDGDYYTGSSHPVGQKKANELGLYDMSGNVWELCYDWCDEEYYSSSPLHNPKGPDDGSFRAIRGGGWLNDEQDCRVTNRDYGSPDVGGDIGGLRLAL